jgi:hypothetical protein
VNSAEGLGIGTWLLAVEDGQQLVREIYAINNAVL